MNKLDKNTGLAVIVGVRKNNQYLLAHRIHQPIPKLRIRMFTILWPILKVFFVVCILSKPIKSVTFETRENSEFVVSELLVRPGR